MVMLMCSLLLGSSCVNKIEVDGNDVAEGDIPIAFTSKVSKAETRVKNQAFDEGDQVSLYAMITPGAIDGKRYIDNLKLEYTGNSSMVPEKTVFYPEGDATLNFVAYYPYQAKGIPTGKSTLTVSVKSNQSKREAYSESDFLVATTSNVESSDAAVSLAFRHQLSLLKIVLVPQGGEKVTDMLNANPNVVVTGFKTQCSYDVRTGKLGTVEKDADMIPYGEWMIDVDSLVGKELVVIPQNIEAGTHSIILEWNKRIYTCPMPSLTVEGGKQYEIKIDARQSGSNVLPGVVGKVDEWITGEGGKTENNDGSWAIHVSAFSFVNSDVYRIYRDGVAVMDICKEYLISSKLTGTAIVAYPLDVNERPDLNNGFLLQMPGTTDVQVGGRLKWDIGNNSFAYTNGDSQEIDKFYINENNEVTLKEPTNPVKVNIVSYLLTDMRKGEVITYPVVKVGVHYWMKENLRATRYRDGTSVARLTTLDGTAGYFQPIDEEIYFYNGEAVMAGELAPEGWKIPTVSEWGLLQTYIDDNMSLIKDGTWLSNTTGGIVQPVNNLTGFASISNGHWTVDGWKAQGKVAGYWAMEDDKVADNIPYMTGEKNELLFSASLQIDHGFYKGVLIRCIKSD
jgi:uncharacterized protein (TIGR02145 family)